LDALRDRAEHHAAPDDILAARREALTRNEQRHGPGSWQTLVASHNLANWFREAGRPAEALPFDRELCEACRSRFGEDDRRTVIAELVLAMTLVDLAFRDEARVLLDHAVRFFHSHEEESKDCRAALDLLATIDRTDHTQ